MNAKILIAITLATLMIISGAGILFSGNPINQVSSQASNAVAVSSHPAPSSSVGGTVSQSSLSLAQRLTERTNILSLAKQEGIPSKYLFLPNFMSTSIITGGHVTPGYSSSPAPMGIGDYGLYNNSGTMETYNYTTSSFEAQVNLTTLNDFYLLDNYPQSVSIQLNAVLNNVALFGESSYQMWTQNVALFSPRTMTLQFEDNVWNFSSPTALLTGNAINYSSAQALGMGATIPSVGYHYGYSNVFPVTFPTVFNLYMNTTLNNSRSTVYYNYSIPSLAVSGTYDEVIFNSTYGQPSYTAPAPHYLVSGTNLTGTGFIPFDAEIMIGGPGGGSTATIYGINGTMNLKFYNATTSSFQNVRAAYDIGSETGETSVGIDVSSVGSTAYLNPGPSLVYGLWNLTASQTSYSVTSNPANAFIFVQNNATLAAENLWAWAPLPVTGKENFTLPAASYTYEAMLNDYNIATGTLTAITSISLVADHSMGIYTPIVANSNAELAAVVSQLGGSGNGTAISPYIISAGSNMINPIFGSMNDYSFPAFAGLLLRNVTAHLNITGVNLPIVYTGANANIIEFFENAYFGMTDPMLLNNSLSVQIYQSSNITIENSDPQAIMPTWYTFEVGLYFYVGQYNIWNSTNINFTNDFFVSLGTTILMYNAPYQPGNNYITGNEFIGFSVSKNIAPTFNASYNLLNGFIANFQYQFGVYLMSGGNYIYDNIFITQFTAVSSSLNYWEGTNTNAYVNVWDNPLGSTTFTLNGAQFIGAGNWYWDYTGTGSYNANGGIIYGSDNNPLFLVNYTDVVFHSTGVPQYSIVSLQGLFESGYGVSTFEYYDFVSTAPYQLSYYVSYVSTLGSGTETGTIALVNGTTTVIEFMSYSTNTVTFKEAGLASGTFWKVSFAGITGSSTSSTITFTGLANGTYTYYINAVKGYNTATSGGTFTVAGDSSMSVTFTAVPTFTVTFNELGLSAGTTWTVVFDSTSYNSNTSTITISGVSSGSHTYTVESVSGYVSVGASGILDIQGTTSIVVTYSTASIGSSTTQYEYLAIGAVVGLIIGGLAVFLIRKPPVGQP